jgi:hypothetical protein
VDILDLIHQDIDQGADITVMDFSKSMIGIAMMRRELPMNQNMYGMYINSIIN